MIKPADLLQDHLQTEPIKFTILSFHRRTISKSGVGITRRNRLFVESKSEDELCAFNLEDGFMSLILKVEGIPANFQTFES
jgi:hypothetical protein